ncbi:class I SAM-dependent methyltransferase [Streptomyces broussonetiae]|uniref:class I SAM-dependent methyltransferase n=1 Tax=Streptomyces broussonetiae TaxID=2686304 RepID=UPI0035D8A9F8
MSRHAAILDYGCGYGRVMEKLEQHGFDSLTGADISPRMIKRAHHLHPGQATRVGRTGRGRVRRSISNLRCS